MKWVMKDANMPVKDIIKNYEKWFKVYLALPRISGILVAVFWFLIGIIVAIGLDSVEGLILWLGIFSAPIVYALIKLYITYMVLHISYLHQILFTSEEAVLRKDSDNNAALGADDEDLPEI